MKPVTAFKKLKSIEFSRWSVTFWLVKRKAAQREASYSVLRVDIDAKLQKRFRGYVKQQLQGRNFHLDEYDFSNADADDVLLTLDTDATDFPKVEQAIEQGFDNQRAREYKDLLNSWAYVIHLEHDGEHFYAWNT